MELKVASISKFLALICVELIDVTRSLNVDLNVYKAKQVIAVEPVINAIVVLGICVIRSAINYCILDGIGCVYVVSGNDCISTKLFI